MNSEVRVTKVLGFQALRKPRAGRAFKRDRRAMVTPDPHAARYAHLTRHFEKSKLLPLYPRVGAMRSGRNLGR